MVSLSVNAVTLLCWGTPVMSLVCAIAWAQKRAWRRPARTPQAAAARAAWQQTWPLPQFGVRTGMDGFVYSLPAGRCLGHAGGAEATIARHVPVGRVKPATATAVITFADGTVHRHLFALRNLAEATAQMARFNGLAVDPVQASFQRTWTP